MKRKLLKCAGALTHALAQAFVDRFRETHPGTEVETVTPETLLALCPMLEAVARQGSSCIIAGQQQLDASADQIDTMVDIPC